MDRETIRHVLLEALETGTSTQLTTLYSDAAMLAVSKGYLPAPDGYVAGPGGGYYSYDSLLSRPEQLLMQEVTWELIIQGILTPGSDTANPNLPFIRLTDYGRRCVQEREVLPQDYGTYLASLQALATSTDPTFLLYITESVQAFNKGLYMSTVVNLGIASEQLTLLLIAAFEDAIKTESTKTKFKEAMNKARFIAPQFDELYKRLELAKGNMPAEIAQDLGMVRYLEELIRKDRNDAGHPSGRTFSREEALVLLIAFPRHYKMIIALLEWLRTATL